MSWARWFSPFALLLVAPGCASTAKRDLLEARLRDQEEMLATYESKLGDLQRDLERARRESDTLRERLAGTSGRPGADDDQDAQLRVAGIQFSSLMTGGTNTNHQPGDDALSVVMVPHDDQGDLVKVPGRIQLEAFDLGAEQGAEPIGRWSFDMTQAREHWHKGVIQSGYQFELPWQQLPRSDQVLLHGRLVTADGRQFDTSHTIRVTPVRTEPGYHSPPPPEDTIQQVSTSGDAFTPPGRNVGQAAHWGRAELSTSTTADDRGSAPSPGIRRHPPATGSKGTRLPAGHAVTSEDFAKCLNHSLPLSIHEPADGNRSPWSGSSSTPAPGGIGHSLQESPASPVNVDVDDSEPRPFPSEAFESRRPVRTSDVWTEAAIPFLR